MGSGNISSFEVQLITMAVIAGAMARVLTLKEDYRQYPSYPNGYLIHMITGFVAAALGAVAIPALLSRNYVAVTFLALAIQQFREIRKMERNSLKDLENTEFTPRGDAYIDGIAKTFESRNYFAFVVALVSALTIQLVHSTLWVNAVAATLSAALVFYAIKRFSKGKVVGDIADIRPGNIEIEAGNLYVDGTFVSNLLGTEAAEKRFISEGLAVVIHPRQEHLRITLDNYGQRQAILFEAVRAVGVKRYHYTRKDYDRGVIIIALIPIVRDQNRLLATVRNAPLLESSKKSHRLMQANLFGGGNAHGGS